MTQEGDPPAAEGDEPVEDTVPEGDYELAMPEGVELDAELLTEASPVLKEVGLGNVKASKLVPIVTKIQERAAEAVQQQMIDQHAATIADWSKETLADPEIGGQNWKTTQANVARALDRFVGPKTIEVVGEDGTKTEQPHPFRALLDSTGIGNHPALVKAFAAIGAAVGEDTTFARAANGGAQPKSREEAMYPAQAAAASTQ